MYHVNKNSNIISILELDTCRGLKNTKMSFTAISNGFREKDEN